MTQDLYYIESGYLTPDSGYYVYTADAESLEAFTASMDITAGVIKEASVTIDCVASVAAVISHIHGADLVAFSNAAITTEINVIRTTNVQLTSVFSAAIDGSRGIYVAAQADSVVSLDITTLRFRATEAALDAAFALTADVTKIAGLVVKEAAADLSSETALVALGGKRQRFEIAQVALSNQYVLAEVTLSLQASLDCQSIVAANVNIIKQLDSALDLSSQVEVTASRISDAAVAITSAFTPILTVDIFRNSFAVLDATSVLSATSTVAFSSQADIQSQSTVSVTVSVSQLATADLLSQSTVTANVIKATRNLPALVTQGGNYGGLSISPTRSKFGAASLKFDANGYAYGLTTPIVSDGSKFVALAGVNNYNNVYATTSTDGVNWTRTLTNIIVGGDGSSYDYPNLLEYNNGYYLARVKNSQAGGAPYYTLWYSTDATSWSSISTWDTTSSPYSIPRWQAGINKWIRYNGFYASSGSFTYTGLVQSSSTINGTWATVTNSLSRSPILGIAFKGSATVLAGSRFDAAGANPRPYIWYSSNTTTFGTQFGPGGSQDSTFYDVACDGTTFVAVGDLGLIYTSTNGSTWTARTSGTTNPLYNVSYLNGIWIIGGSGIILTSSDAVNWTQRASYTMYLDPPSYYNGKYLSKNITSSDAVTWTTYKNDYDLPNQTPSITFEDTDKWSTWQTIDFWVYAESRSADYSANPIFKIYQGSSNYWEVRLLEYVTSGTANTGRISYYVNGSSGTTTGTTFNYGQWNHIRLARNGNVYASYLNGTRVATNTFSNLVANSNPLTISSGANSNGVYYIDEVLVTDALLVNPTVTTFTVPTTAYTNTADTGLLLHFDTDFGDDALQFPLIRIADSAMVSTATQVTQAIKTVDATANLSVTATMSTVAVKNAEIILTAFSDAALAVDYTRIRFADSAQASEFTQVTQTDRLRSAESAQASEFTQTVSVVKTVDVAIATDAIFTELVAVAKTNAGFIQLDATANLVIDAVKTTDVTSSANSLFNQTANTVKSVEVAATISSQASLDATILRIRNQVLVYASNAQLEAVVGKIEQFSIDLTAVSLVLAETGGIREAFADLASQASLDATILRIRDGSSSQASEFTQTTNSANSLVRNAQASIDSAVTITANAGTIKESAITTDAIFTELAAVAKTGQGFITLDIQANQTAQAVKTTDITSSQSTSSALVANAGTRFDVAAALDTAFTFAGSGTFVTTANAHVTMSATLACQPVKSTDVISIEASAGTLTADISVKRAASASLSVLAFELALGDKTAGVAANLVSATNLTAKIGGTFNFQAAMQGFASELVVADIIHIDAKLTWMIFAENRSYAISAENRTSSIQEEDREYGVIFEDRTYKVTRELLEVNLQG